MEDFNLEVLRSMAERTIRKLWVLIIILVVLLFATNTLWVIHEMSYEDYTITQEVEQDADNGENLFVGGDYHGEAESKNHN